MPGISEQDEKSSGGFDDIMTDELSAGKVPTVAWHIARLSAGRSSGGRLALAGPLGHWACSFRQPYGHFAPSQRPRHGLVAGCAAELAPRGSRVGCRQRRSRSRVWVLERSSTPAWGTDQYCVPGRDCAGASLRGGEAYLNQVLALSLSDERLQLRRGKGVDKPGLGHDEKEDLGTRQDGQLVGLQKDQVSVLQRGECAVFAARCGGRLFAIEA